MADRLFSSQADISTLTEENPVGASPSTMLGIGGGVLGAEDTPISSLVELLVERQLNSASGASSSTQSTSNAMRELNSQADVSTSSQSELRAERRLESIVNKVFSGVSDIEATRCFNSVSSVTTSNVSELNIMNYFDSVVGVQTSGVSTGNADRWFDSQLDVVVSTVSELDISNVFVSSLSISTTTEDIEADWNIAGYKKLEYLTDSFVSDHIEYFNPKFKDLVRVFLRYLDYYPMLKTLTLTNNNDLNKIFPEFLDFYLNQYLYGVVDLSKYDLTDSNKQLFLLLSRLLNNSKGNKKAFSYLFRSLTNIRIANEDIQIAVDKIIAEFIENETWWSIGDLKYYDATYDYDGTITYEAVIPRPFTYQFKIDQNRETMLPLIQAVHPAGFQQEFLIEMEHEDDQSFNDILETTATYYHFYSYGEPNKTWYTYDGSIDYSGSRQIIETA